MAGNRAHLRSLPRDARGRGPTRARPTCSSSPATRARLASWPGTHRLSSRCCAQSGEERERLADVRSRPRLHHREAGLRRRPRRRRRARRGDRRRAGAPRGRRGASSSSAPRAGTRRSTAGTPSSGFVTPRTKDRGRRQGLDHHAPSSRPSGASDRFFKKSHRRGHADLAQLSSYRGVTRPVTRRRFLAGVAPLLAFAPLTKAQSPQGSHARMMEAFQQPEGLDAPFRARRRGTTRRACSSRRRRSPTPRASRASTSSSPTTGGSG